MHCRLPPKSSNLTQVMAVLGLHCRLSQSSVNPKQAAAGTLVCIVALPKQPQAQYQEKSASTYILTPIRWPQAWDKWRPDLACNVVPIKRHKRQAASVCSIDSPKHLQAQHNQPTTTAGHVTAPKESSSLVVAQLGSHQNPSPKLQPQQTW